MQSLSIGIVFGKIKFSLITQWKKVHKTLKSQKRIVITNRNNFCVILITVFV